MKSLQVLAVIGGNSKESLNKKLFHAMKDNAPAGFTMLDFNLAELPFFSQDLEKTPPEIVTEFRKTIQGADAILFITPEYNRSIPGILKNAIDWGSRPYGANSWKGKPTGVMGASSGNIGTFGAQAHLRGVLSYLEMTTMGQPEFYFNGSKAFDENGKLSDPKSKEFIGKYWTAFAAWITQQKLAQDALKA